MTDSPQSSFARLTGVAIAAVALMAAGIMYRVLVWRHLEQTSLLFMGIPGLLAVALATGRKTKTVTGGIMRATAIGLLLSGPLLAKGSSAFLWRRQSFFWSRLLSAAPGTRAAGSSVPRRFPVSSCCSAP